MAEIAAEVAERHGLTVQELKSPSRSRRIVWPRHEAMFEMAKTGRWSMPRIGMFFDGMDHTSVMYGRAAHRRRMLGLPPLWRDGRISFKLTDRDILEVEDEAARRGACSEERAVA